MCEYTVLTFKTDLDSNFHLINVGYQHSLKPFEILPKKIYTQSLTSLIPNELDDNQQNFVRFFLTSLVILLGYTYYRYRQVKESRSKSNTEGKFLFFSP